MKAKVIDNLQAEKYFRLKDEHASGLKHLLVSPRAYHYATRYGSVTETDAMRAGRAVHTAVLEPDKFLREFVLWEGGRRYGKEWDAFSDANSAKTILTSDQYDLALKVRDAVRNHSVAGKHLETGRAELTIRWTHAATGTKIKCRPDWLGVALVDLKSTRDPSPSAFASTAARLRYPLQLGLYADAVAAAGLGAPPVKIIAAQSSEPFDVVCYDIGAEVLDEGRRQYERALELLAECRASKRWPGQAPDEVPLVLPAWASSSTEQEIDFGSETIGGAE